DKRHRGNVVPLGFHLMQSFLNAGFKLKEIIIKEQHNCKSTDKWINVEKKFLMLAHEYIFVFYK
ncbi:MAG: site-specific DNA-methyltransferase, partial [Lachnoanaerobaculum gingivalis]